MTGALIPSHSHLLLNLRVQRLCTACTSSIHVDTQGIEPKNFLSTSRNGVDWRTHGHNLLSLKIFTFLHRRGQIPGPSTDRSQLFPADFAF